MRKDSRANAAIFILDEFLAGQNLNAILSKWSKTNRYAGSSDRESIRDIVFDILRVKKTFTFLLNKEKQLINGRALVFLYSVYYSLPLNDIFTGQKYGPDKLNIYEKEFSEIAMENNESVFEVIDNIPDFLIHEFKRSLGSKFNNIMRLLERRAPEIFRIDLDLYQELERLYKELPHNAHLTIQVSGAKIQISTTQDLANLFSKFSSKIQALL